MFALVFGWNPIYPSCFLFLVVLSLLDFDEPHLIEIIVTVEWCSYSETEVQDMKQMSLEELTGLSSD